MLYRIRNPDIRKIALVPRPANGNTWHLFKQAPELGQIIKADRDDWKVAYVVVAEPGKVEAGGIGPDGQVVKGEDGQPIMDVWDEQTIREAAHSFARNGGLTVDAHFTDGQTLGRWAESYIAPVDHQIEGRPIKEGSWVLAIEPTAEGREAIQDGRIGGVSVEGPASRETVAKEDDGCGCEDTEPLPDELVDALTVALAKAALSTGQRKQLSRSDFAIPPDRYPIQDRAHAINALARVAQNGSAAEQAQVRKAVCRRYPDLPACKGVAKARPTPTDPDGDGDVDLPSPKARAMYRRLRAKGMSVKQALALTQKALGIRDSDDMAKANGAFSPETVAKASGGVSTVESRMAVAMQLVREGKL